MRHVVRQYMQAVLMLGRMAPSAMNIGPRAGCLAQSPAVSTQGEMADSSHCRLLTLQCLHEALLPATSAQTWGEVYVKQVIILFHSSPFC